MNPAANPNRRNTMKLAALASLPLVLGCLPAQDLVAIKAGKVITISGGTLENQVILIENGRIKQIAAALEPSWNAKVIDASDKVVMPTYILAHTDGGMSRGANENMQNVPYLTVQDAVDPSDRFFENCLRNGIGTLHVLPGNRTLLGGQGMILRPYGRTVEDMAVRTRGALKMSLEGGSGSRVAQVRKLRRVFEDAEEYGKERARKKAEFEKEKAAGATDKKEFDEPIDKTKKPVLDLLDGKLGAHLWVPGAAEVPEALRIARKYSFPLSLVVGSTAWKAGRQLKSLGKPVILDANTEYWETDPETEVEKQICPPAELARLGVEFALDVGSSGATAYPWWQLATCVRHGVDRKTALAAFTTVPAAILGLTDELGTVEVGKVANLQILTGDPFAATSWVDSVLLEGEVVYERSKDPRLQHLFGKKTSSSN